METAAFLQESEDVGNNQWRRFSSRFFIEYHDTILQYYGYENQVYYTLPREVNYPRFFIAVMSVLLELKIVGCSKAELVNTLYGAFRFRKERSTVRKWFYEVPPEYEELLTTFKNLFSTLKIKN